MEKDFNSLILDSLKNTEGNVNSTESILQWIDSTKKSTSVNIRECSIGESEFWFYDDYNGEILNKRRSFFSIKGIRYFENHVFVKEQPVIIQPEIGYLGIICSNIDGVLNFLMQAKVEPGNVNTVQISPTIQATKSNFTRAHGGAVPVYLDLFEDLSTKTVLYDQIQSEQGSRFLKKRNRNMVVYMDEEIEIYPNFKWMTLGQIKELMEIENLVNMDTRTVISGIPISDISPDPLALSSINQKINNYKMFNDIQIASVPLNQLVDWTVDEFGITCKKPADFMVRYYDISISGREVINWSQPLFKAKGSATFGLLTCVSGGNRKYLVKAVPEIGSFDKVEIGPTIMSYPNHSFDDKDEVQRIFKEHLDKNTGILKNVILSEEGGRFYHEQNRNVIIEIDSMDFPLPNGYVWVDYSTLYNLIIYGNSVNIQLRNLIALMTS